MIDQRKLDWFRCVVCMVPPFTVSRAIAMRSQVFFAPPRCCPRRRVCRECSGWFGVSPSFSAPSSSPLLVSIAPLFPRSTAQQPRLRRVLLSSLLSSCCVLLLCSSRLLACGVTRDADERRQQSALQQARSHRSAAPSLAHSRRGGRSTETIRASCRVAQVGARSEMHDESNEVLTALLLGSQQTRRATHTLRNSLTHKQPWQRSCGHTEGVQEARTASVQQLRYHLPLV